MAQQNYLDKDGVLYLWQKLKGIFATKTEADGKVDKIEGKGLSTNDYTTAEKNKLAGVASGSQVNVIESIKKNGTALAVTDKTVDVTVPTKTSDITNDSGFITIDDVPDGAVASTTTPEMDGTASAGSETAFARGDHVHPSDTSRVPISRTVAGHALTEDITITKGDVGLGNVDNTSDTNKPVSTAQQAALDGKVDKVDGKGLSTNDYTTAEKTKLAGIDEGATKVTYNGGSNDKVLLDVSPTWVLGEGNSILNAIAFRYGTGTFDVLTTLDATSASSAIAKKVDKVTGKGLSTNDYTTAEKTKLAGIEEGANVITFDTPGPSGEVDVKDSSGNTIVTFKTNDEIDTIVEGLRATDDALDDKIDGKVSKVSGKGLSTNDYTTAEKNKLASFGSADTYALKTDITGMYKYKGSVATVSALPSTGNTTGDVYNVEASGMNYAWNGTAWDSLGEIFQITSITNAEIDTIVAS